MTKPARLTLLKAIGARISIREKMENNKTTSAVSSKRGRPCKLIADITKKIDNFDFDQLKDDAGVILPKAADLEEELKVAGTFV